MTKIVSVEVIKFGEPRIISDSGIWAKEGIMTRPYSMYPEERSEGWVRTGIGEVAVKITCDEGVYGLGSAGGYKIITADIIEHLLKPLILGKNPLEIEKLWDIMYKVSIPVGRRGAVIEAISAVDIALWDLMGKLLGQPVYQLLGGKVRDKLSVYATGPDVALHKRMGFRDMKIPVPYGPAHGKEGMRKNIEYIEGIRGEIGSEGDIMLDCYMGWDEEYTVSMAHALKDYGIRWIEEPLTPDNLIGYKRLRDILNPMGILITGGEHEFTRWGAYELLRNGCVDILQTDVWRSGGISELKKICAIASVFNTKVIPHEHGMPAYHISINSTVSPFAEIIVRSGYPRLFLNEPEPVNGIVELSDAPGFGYELNYDYADIIQ